MLLININTRNRFENVLYPSIITIWQSVKNIALCYQIVIKSVQLWHGQFWQITRSIRLRRIPAFFVAFGFSQYANQYLLCRTAQWNPSASRINCLQGRTERTALSDWIIQLFENRRLTILHAFSMGELKALSTQAAITERF